MASDSGLLPSSTSTGPGRRKRVQSACQRCKRQKLKCDDNRPCALCERSGFECIPVPRDNGTNSLPRPGSETSGDRVAQDRSTRVVPQKRKRTAKRLSVRSSNQSNDEVPDILHQGNEMSHSEPDSEIQVLTSNTLQQHTQGNSAIGLTREIFQTFDSAELQDETYALPGGTPNTQSSRCLSQPEPQISMLELVGMELPSREVCDFLLETYINSVHWFMMVFHEPSFRTEYEKIMTTGKTTRRRIAFVILLLMVFAMGARYATAETARIKCPGIDLDALQKSFLAKTTENMFEIYDMGQLEAVQISILLGSYHLYHARPNLAFAMLGAGIKCAQGMGLHRESSSKKCSQINRETRKRAWWAIYCFDRFASIIYGRPCSIQDQDCDVSMVETLDDTSASHPLLGSMESLEGLPPEPVTLMSYQKYKFRLYGIASDVIKEVYFNKQVKALRVNNVRIVHQQLLHWYRSLPPELRLDGSSTTNATNVVKLFRLQALALQLAYDNIQILLHRPLLPVSLQQGSTGVRPRESEPEGSASHKTNDAVQCWESALRTSKVAKHIDVLRAAKNTHAAAYVGMQMFTAGILLSVVALSGSGSTYTQESKKAIGRIIRLSNAFGQHAVLSAQSGKVLSALLRLIMEKEMRELLQDGESDNEVDLLATATATPAQAASPTDHSGTAEITMPPSNDLNDDNGLLYAMSNELESARLATSSFNEGLWSVQQVIRHSNENAPSYRYFGNITDQATMTEQRAPNDMTQEYQSNETSIEGDRLNYLFGSNFELNDGQTWLWDTNLSFDLL